MAKLTYQFDSAFVCDVPNSGIKKALKKELFTSFGVEESKNNTALVEYFIENFFWEFLNHFQEELLVIFEDYARDEYSKGDFS